MNIININPIYHELTEIVKHLSLMIRQRFFFAFLGVNSYLKRILTNKDRFSSGLNSYTMHICHSTSKLRAWSSYSVNSYPQKKISTEYFTKKQNSPDHIRIIIPNGLRKLEKLTIGAGISSVESKSRFNNKIKKIDISKKQLRYYRNINHLDIPIKEKIDNFEVIAKGTNISLQATWKKKNIYDNTIFVILDAVDYKSFIDSSVYKKYFAIDDHFLCEGFSPSSVTGSSLPSLLTLKPVLMHCLGDYNQWFFSPNLECLPKQIPTLAEHLNQYLDYFQAFTSFSKTMPFYSYHRGFSVYHNRCSGNNFSPSALDLINMEFQESHDLFNSINSHFTFIHDIGAHPPVHPSFRYFNEKSNVNISSLVVDDSYTFTVDLSLRKLNSLIQTLSLNKQLESTNIIITADHTKSSTGFNKNNYHLFPERLSTPIYFRPSSNFRLNEFKEVANKYLTPTPSTHVLSDIFNAIYKFDLRHPEYKFNNISWLSTVYSYPNRDKIYTIGYDIDRNQFVSTTIMSSDLKLFTRRKTLDNVSIFTIKAQERVEIKKNCLYYKLIFESFLSYVFNCRQLNTFPVLQRDLSFSI